MLPKPDIPSSGGDLLTFAIDYYHRKRKERDNPAMVTGVYCAVQALLIHAGYSNAQIDDLLGEQKSRPAD